MKHHHKNEYFESIPEKYFSMFSLDMSYIPFCGCTQSMIMLVRWCCLLAIECQRMEMAMEHRNLTMKWQVSAIQIKTVVIFSL